MEDERVRNTVQTHITEPPSILLDTTQNKNFVQTCVQ